MPSHAPHALSVVRWRRPRNAPTHDAVNNARHTLSQRACDATTHDDARDVLIPRPSDTKTTMARATRVVTAAGGVGRGAGALP